MFKCIIVPQPSVILHFQSSKHKALSTAVMTFIDGSCIFLWILLFFSGVAVTIMSCTTADMCLSECVFVNKLNAGWVFVCAYMSILHMNVVKKKNEASFSFLILQPCGADYNHKLETWIWNTESQQWIQKTKCNHKIPHSAGRAIKEKRLLQTAKSQSKTSRTLIKRNRSQIMKLIRLKETVTLRLRVKGHQHQNCRSTSTVTNVYLCFFPSEFLDSICIYNSIMKNLTFNYHPAELKVLVQPNNCKQITIKTIHKSLLIVRLFLLLWIPFTHWWHKSLSIPKPVQFIKLKLSGYQQRKVM